MIYSSWSTQTLQTRSSIQFHARSWHAPRERERERERERGIMENRWWAVRWMNGLSIARWSLSALTPELVIHRGGNSLICYLHNKCGQRRRKVGMLYDKSPGWLAAWHRYNGWAMNHFTVFREERMRGALLCQYCT